MLIVLSMYDLLVCCITVDTRNCFVFGTISCQFEITTSDFLLKYCLCYTNRKIFKYNIILQKKKLFTFRHSYRFFIRTMLSRENLKSFGKLTTHLVHKVRSPLSVKVWKKWFLKKQRWCYKWQIICNVLIN